MLAKFGPKSGQLWPKFTKLDQSPLSARFWPNLADVCQNVAKISQCWANLGQTWPQFGPKNAQNSVPGATVRLLLRNCWTSLASGTCGAHNVRNLFTRLLIDLGAPWLQHPGCSPGGVPGGVLVVIRVLPPPVVPGGSPSGPKWCHLQEVDSRIAPVVRQVRSADRSKFEVVEIRTLRAHFRPLTTTSKDPPSGLRTRNARPLSRPPVDGSWSRPPRRHRDTAGTPSRDHTGTTGGPKGGPQGRAWKDRDRPPCPAPSSATSQPMWRHDGLQIRSQPWVTTLTTAPNQRLLHPMRAKAPAEERRRRSSSSSTPPRPTPDDLAGMRAFLSFRGVSCQGRASAVVRHTGHR